MSVEGTSQSDWESDVGLSSRFATAYVGSVNQSAVDGPFEVRLTHRPSTRIAAALGAPMLLLVSLLLLVVVVAVLDQWVGGPVVAFIGFPAAALLLLGGLAATYELGRRAVVRAGRLRVEESRLLLLNPTFLKRPIVFDRDRIRAIAIDSPESAGWWRPRDALLSESLDDMPGSVGSDDLPANPDALTRELHPHLTHDPQTPANVALLVAGRLDAGAFRRGSKLGREIESLDKEGARDSSLLLLTVDDPQALAIAVAPWGVDRKFGREELDFLRPTPVEKRGLLRGRLLRTIAVVYGALVATKFIWDAQD